MNVHESVGSAGTDKKSDSTGNDSLTNSTSSLMTVSLDESLAISVNESPSHSWLLYLDCHEWIQFVLALSSLIASIECLDRAKLPQQWLKYLAMQFAMILPVGNHIYKQLGETRDPAIRFSSALARACVTPLLCVLAIPTAVAYVCSKVVPQPFIPYVLSPLQVVAGMSLWCVKLVGLKLQLRKMPSPLDASDRNILVFYGVSNPLLDEGKDKILLEINDQMFAVIEFNIYVVLASLCLSGIFVRINAMTPHPSDTKVVALQLAPAILTLCVALPIYNYMKAISPDNKLRPVVFRPVVLSHCVFGGKQGQVVGKDAIKKLLSDEEAGDYNASPSS